MTADDLAFYRASKPVMACGHVSNAIYTSQEGEKQPICSLCAKTTPEIAKQVVSLKGRVAECIYCGSKAPSAPDLFAFHYNGNKNDSFYDGCRG